MSNYFLVLGLTFLCYFCFVHPIADLIDCGPNSIPGKYIIVHHTNVSTSYIKLQIMKYINFSDKDSIALSFTKLLDGLKMVFVKLTAEKLEFYRKDPSVKYVACDNHVNVTLAPWGVDYVLGSYHTTDQIVSFPGVDGSNVHVFVVDSGIRTTHQELKGKVVQSWAADPTWGGIQYFHGTHVAGTIAGNTVGIAPGVKLHDIRVFYNASGGTVSNVIAGLDQVINQTKTNGYTSIASMSLGGGTTTILDDVVQQAIDVGVHVVVAAGNSNVDACGVSPARAPNAITVGAINSTGTKAWYSNYGSCVSVWAPGGGVNSSTIDSDTSYGVHDGTSMATPHVTGVLALHLGLYGNQKPAIAKELLVYSYSRWGVINGVSTNNRLLHFSPPSTLPRWVYFRTWNGTYLSVGSSTVSSIFNQQQNPTTSEIFELVPLEPNSDLFAIRNVNWNVFVSANGSTINTQSYVGDYEKFRIRNEGGFWYIWSNYYQLFLSAMSDGVGSGFDFQPYYSTWESFLIELASPPSGVASANLNMGSSLTQYTQSLVSPNGQFVGIVQSDRNFVIYKNGVATWATNTGLSTPPASTTFSFTPRSDGNLVLYSGSTAIWQSMTNGTRGSLTSGTLTLLDGGNLIWYGSGLNYPLNSIWTSGFGGCCFYEAENKQGRYICLSGDIPSLVLIGWNDIISSVSCSANYRALAYTVINYGGDVYSYGCNSVTTYVGDTANDKFSSLKVGPCSTSLQGCCFFENQNYQGRKVCLTSNVSSLVLLGFNDMISSYICDALTGAVAYTDINGGSSVVYQCGSSSSYVGDSYNDLFSSIKINPSSCPSSSALSAEGMMQIELGEHGHDNLWLLVGVPVGVATMLVVIGVVVVKKKRDLVSRRDENVESIYNIYNMY